jgi:ribosomal protein S18 acetylase RimI-like enzyme
MTIDMMEGMNFHHQNRRRRRREVPTTTTMTTTTTMNRRWSFHVFFAAVCWMWMIFALHPTIDAFQYDTTTTAWRSLNHHRILHHYDQKTLRCSCSQKKSHTTSFVSLGLSSCGDDDDYYSSSSVNPAHDEQQSAKKKVVAAAAAVVKPQKYKIRQCEYSELGQVADLIMDSFYTTTTTETSGGFIWKRLYKLAELNRLQQNFAYPDQADQHQMLVVELQADSNNNNNNNNNGHRSNAIVGFCDVDDRPLPLDFKVQLPPRPYLSDLCIAVDHRRRGLASALVEHAERFCIETTLEEDDSDSDNVVLWIRVQEANTAALAMYQRLGYQIVSKNLDTTTTTFQKAAENKEMIYTLRKHLK